MTDCQLPETVYMYRKTIVTAKKKDFNRNTNNNNNNI